MRKVIATLAATAAMLFATAAFPEDANSEQSAAMQRAINRVQARDAARSGFLPSIFGGINFGFVDPGRAEVGSSYGRKLRPRYDDPVEFWPGNFRGGRVHGPAGR